MKSGPFESILLCSINLKRAKQSKGHSSMGVLLLFQGLWVPNLHSVRNFRNKKLQTP